MEVKKKTVSRFGCGHNCVFRVFYGFYGFLAYKEDIRSEIISSKLEDGIKQKQRNEGGL